MHYSLKSSLRFTSNAMLRDYFEPRALLQDIQWDGLGEADLDEVHEAIRSLPEASFREINNHFRAIW
ncbi:MAG TPA: hypothetical protein PLZ95_11940, partial [Bryobacteraceae bacterium]|nr:hypothetical protein [Bryobacteraceae bacterium]